MTLCGQICDYMEDAFPLQNTSEWDNVGLLVGYRNQPVKNVLLCLDVTSEVLRESVDSECQMIISHHPLIFKPLTGICGKTSVQDTVYEAIRHGICVYSAHTNMDFSQGGMNDMMAELLQLKDIRSLDKEKELKLEGFGRIGVLEDEMFLYELIGSLKTMFNTRSVRYTGDDVKTVKKVALSTGSFDGNSKAVSAWNPDIFITGEMKYHEMLDLVAMGVDVALIGHYESEVIFKEPLRQRLSKAFPDVSFLCSQAESGILK